MRGEGQAELDRLRQAQQICHDYPEVIVALLDYHRRIGLPEGEHDRLHAELLQTLRDPEVELPAGITSHLLFEPDLDREIMLAALAALERRLEGSDNDDPGLLRTLAAAERRLELYEQAAATLERVYEVSPSESDDWTLVALYERLGRFDDQARVLARIAQGSEASSFVGTLRVQALTRAGLEEEALRELDSIAESIDRTSPYQLVPYLELVLAAAWNLRDAGRDQQAEALFRRVVELAPDSHVARDALIHYYADDQEKAELARAAAASALGTSGNGGEVDPFALYERGTRLLTSSDYEGAYPLLAQAAPAIGDLEAAWFNLAMTAYRLEKWSEASDAYDRAAELNPERSDSWFFSGMASIRSADCEAAVHSLERALEIDPERHLAHYHLASCYDELGDAARAIQHRRAWNEAQKK